MNLRARSTLKATYYAVVLQVEQVLRRFMKITLLYKTNSFTSFSSVVLGKDNKFCFLVGVEKGCAKQ